MFRLPLGSIFVANLSALNIGGENKRLNYKVLIILGQCRGHSEQQRRDERLRHHWTCCQGVCGPVAQDCEQREQYCINISVLLFSDDLQDLTLRSSISVKIPSFR